MPLHHHWAKLAVSYWNSLVKRTDTLAHMAFKEDIRLCLVDKYTCSQTWVGFMLRFLRQIGQRPLWDEAADINSTVEYLASFKLPVHKVMAAYSELLDAEWRKPHLCVCPNDFVKCAGKGTLGVKSCRYLHWVGLPNCVGDPPRMPQHASVYMRRVHHHSLMRFRIGAWMLNGNNDSSIPRERRVCHLCDMNALEDEWHVGLVCPAYNSIRSKHGVACEPGWGLRGLLGCIPAQKLGHMLFDIEQHRAALAPS